MKHAGSRSAANLYCGAMVVSRGSGEHYPVRSMRLVVRRSDGSFRKLARIYWTSRDASLYIQPYAPTSRGRAYAGVSSTEVGQVDLTAQGSGAEAYLSLHASGATHASCRRPSWRTPDIAGPSLFSTQRSHVATVQCFDVQSLPLLGGEPKGPPDVDIVLVQRDEYPTVVVAVFVSADASRVAGDHITITMRRPGMEGPLHFGFRVRGANLPHDGAAGGAMVIGGWGVDADEASGDPLPFVYAGTGENATSSP
ncbi:hypothetical protein SAMN04488563_2011 [Jiangella alkaliphila]|uniref:Uncharacterized protein n=1 Tax=Jiangella alkaliphila TaxID=419479 RepID=A0A1H2ITX7_9ACTN|nr:hypothetical protein SAMN04488563_2011 [Jiangella alkaliphila]